MKYCSQCGETVSQRIPADDNRQRYVCDSCEFIHYQNPKIITGCLPVYEDKVLMCLRAIEPRKGLWTLPAGFMENRETAAEGALRETMEEANARAKIIDLYTVFSLPHISQVYVFYRAELTDLEFYAGPESIDCKLYTETEIPWDQLAFPVVSETLKHYFHDRQLGVFPTHEANIYWENGQVSVRESDFSTAAATRESS